MGTQRITVEHEKSLLNFVISYSVVKSDEHAHLKLINDVMKGSTGGSHPDAYVTNKS